MLTNCRSSHALLAVPLALCCAFASAEIPTVTTTTRVYKEVNGKELSIKITSSADDVSTAPRPAIVFFHGGGWVGGAPGQFDAHAKYFASRGLVCFQVEYRLLGRDSETPPTKCIEDAQEAMRWVRNHAHEWGVDVDRVASAGGSAGGHLAAVVGCMDDSLGAAATNETSAKSNAMLLFNPVYNNAPGEWGNSRVKDRVLEFSPAHNISSDDPPAIVFLGSNDKLVPVSTAARFRDQLTAVGVENELHVFEGQGHGFFNTNRDKGRWYRQTVRLADRFLIRLGWLDGNPTISNAE